VAGHEKVLDTSAMLYGVISNSGGSRSLDKLSDQEVEELYIYHMALNRTSNPSGKDQRKAKRLFYRLKAKGRWDPARGRKQLLAAGYESPQEKAKF
ncbi:MAG: hypothetical protein Q8P59_07340, partial [Dehalococcoidia bacterium]|nr:hypothetical protein [Dehalococcoidia bacterium]